MDKTRPTYDDLLREVARLTQENASLRRCVIELGGKFDEPKAKAQVSKPPLLQLSLDEKVELFRSLFKGREDVFAKRL